MRAHSACAHASGADLDDAYQVARLGFLAWCGTAPTKRAAGIGGAAHILHASIEDVATFMTPEQGKPVAGFGLEVLRACDIMTWDVEESRHLYGRVIPTERGLHQFGLAAYADERGGQYRGNQRRSGVRQLG